MVFNMPTGFKKNSAIPLKENIKRQVGPPFRCKSISKKIFARNRSQKKFFDTSKEEHQEARCMPSEWVGRVGLYAIRGNERMNSYGTLRVKDVLQAAKCLLEGLAIEMPRAPWAGFRQARGLGSGTNIKKMNS